MAVLPAQTIRQLCKRADNQLIVPFHTRYARLNMTGGLGPCTYDMRIAQTMVLWPIWLLPLYAILVVVRYAMRDKLFPNVRCFFTLASTMERVSFPSDICGTVLDKSSNARRGLSVFNTKFDPGFEGYPTIELHNCGLRVLWYKKGTPICQFKFERLEAPTEMPYIGRYQGQGNAPTPYREAQGVWT